MSGRARPFVKLYTDLVGGAKLNRAAAFVQRERPDLTPEQAEWLVTWAWTKLTGDVMLHLTDGELQPSSIRNLGAADVAIPAFIHAHICDQRRDGSIWLHNWLRYYPSASTIKERARLNRERQKRHRNRARPELSVTSKTH